MDELADELPTGTLTDEQVFADVVGVEPVVKNKPTEVRSKDELAKDNTELQPVKLAEGFTRNKPADNDAFPATSNKKVVEPAEVKLDKNGYNYGRKWVGDYISAEPEDKGMLDLYDNVIGSDPALASAFFSSDDDGRKKIIEGLVEARHTTTQSTPTASGRPGAPRKVLNDAAYARDLAVLSGFVDRLSDADAEPDDAPAKGDKKPPTGKLRAAGDIATAVGGGAAKGLVDLGSVAGRAGVAAFGAGGFWGEVVDYADRGSKAITEGQDYLFSEDATAQRKAISEGVKGGFGSALSALGDNKFGAVLMLGESLGSLVAPGGVGAKLGGAVAKAGSKAAGQAANVGVIAAAAGEGAGREAYDTINAMPVEDAKKLTAWNEQSALLKEQLGRAPTDIEVKDSVAINARTMTSLVGSGAAAAGMLVGGSPVVGLMQRAMGAAEGVAVKSVAGAGTKAVLATAAKEGVTEGLEEGAQAAAKAYYTGNDPLGPETFGSAAVGGALGAAAGAGVQVATAGRINNLEARAAEEAKKNEALATPTQPVVDPLAATPQVEDTVSASPAATNTAPRDNGSVSLQDFLLDNVEKRDTVSQTAVDDTLGTDPAEVAARTVNLQNVLADNFAARAELEAAVEAPAAPVDNTFHDASPAMDDDTPQGIFSTPLMINLHNIGNAKMAAQVSGLVGDTYNPNGAVFFEAPNHQRWAKRARADLISEATANGNTTVLDSRIVYSDNDMSILQRKDADGEYRWLFAKNDDNGRAKFDHAIATLDDNDAKVVSAVTKVMQFNGGQLGYTPVSDALRVGERVKESERRADEALAAQVNPDEKPLSSVLVQATPELVPDTTAAPEAVIDNAVAAVRRAASTKPPKVVAMQADEAAEIVTAAITDARETERVVNAVRSRNKTPSKRVIEIRPAGGLEEATTRVVEELVQVTQKQGALLSADAFLSPSLGKQYQRMLETARDSVYLARRAEGEEHIVAAREAFGATGVNIATGSAQAKALAAKVATLHPNDAKSKAAADLDAVRAFADKAVRDGEVDMPDRQSLGPVLDKHIDVASLRALAEDAERRFSSLGLRVFVAGKVEDFPTTQRGAHSGFKGVIRQGKEGPYVLLTADRIADAADAKATINHEVLGHFVLRAFLADDGMARLATDVLNAKDAGIRATREAVKAEYPPGTGSDIIAEETIARIIAGEGSQPKGTVAAARSILFSLLSKTGLYSDAVTADVVRQIGAQAVDYLASKNKTGDYINQTTESPLFTNEFNSRGYLDGGRQKLERITTEPTLVESKFDSFMRATFDRLDPLERVIGYAETQGYSRERINALRNAFRGYITAVHNRTAELRNIVSDDLSANFLKLSKDTGLSLDEVARHIDKAAWARHAPERNYSSWLETAPVHAEAAKARAKVMDDFREGKLSPAEYLPALAEIVRDDTVIKSEFKSADGTVIRTSENKRASWKLFTGLTDAEARRLEANALGKFAGHEEQFETVMAALRRINDFAMQEKLRAGLLNERVHAARGWSNYVPLRGGIRELETLYNFGDTNPFEVLQKNIASLAKGRDGEVEHVMTESVAQAQDAIVSDVSSAVVSKLADVVNFTRAFGETFEPRGDFDKGPGNGLSDSVYLYRDNDGNRRGLNVKDKVLNDMLKDIIQPAPLSAAHSTAIQATSFLARFYTTRNPFYVPRAAMLDVGQAALALGLEVSPTAAAKFLKEYGKRIATGWGSDASKFLAADDEQRARMYKDLKGTYGKGSPLASIIERYENNGFISYQRRYGADVLSEEIKLGRPEGQNDLVTSLPVYGKFDSAVQHVGSFFENATRQAVYDALRHFGADANEAALRARTTTLDFHQRSSVGRNMGALYGFAQTSLSGTQRSARMLSNNGEGFFRQERMPDGRIQQVFDPSRINKAGITFLAVAGALLGAATVAGLGDDEAKKIKADGMLDHVVVPFSSNEPGSFFKLPVERGIHQLLFGIGQMSALYAMGTHSGGDVSTAVSNGMVKSLLPIGRIDNVFDDNTGSIQKSYGAIISGLLPTLIKPFGDERFNRNAFGGELDNRNRMSSKDRYQSDIGRANTASFWKDVATAGREFAGVDMAPEVYQHYASSFVAPVARAIDAYARAGRVNEKTGGNYSAVDAVLDSFLPKDRSAASYEVRKSIEAEAKASNALKDMYHARRLDEEAGARKKGDRGVVGPNEAAWVRNNPEAAAIAKTRAGFNKIRTELDNQLREARRNGNVEAAATIQDNIRSLSVKAAAEFVKIDEKTKARRSD